MNKDHLIYELTDAQRRALVGENANDGSADVLDEQELAVLREDVARLDGYLKGRADSDAPRIRPNSDLTRRSGDGKP